MSPRAWPGRAPADNGLPIEAYEVAWDGGAQVCDASPCLVTGLTNATEHRFTVRARNAVGFGQPSGASAPVVPDEVPEAPVDPRVVDPANRTVTVTWGAAPTNGSSVDQYLVTWPGGRLETASTSVTAGGPGQHPADAVHDHGAQQGRVGPGGHGRGPVRRDARDP